MTELGAWLPGRSMRSECPVPARADIEHQSSNGIIWSEADLTRKMGGVGKSADEVAVRRLLAVP
jgi:hypothetical protein